MTDLGLRREATGNSKMYFCIRDDDTSFFTSPEELERAYGDIVRWGPVSLAVVPFHRAGTSKGVPEKFRGRWTVHRLHENQELVQSAQRREWRPIRNYAARLLLETTSRV